MKRTIHRGHVEVFVPENHDPLIDKLRARLDSYTQELNREWQAGLSSVARKMRIVIRKLEGGAK